MNLRTVAATDTHTDLAPGSLRFRRPLTLALLMAIAVVVLSIFTDPGPSAQDNQGSFSPALADGPINIFAPIDLTNRSAAEILGIRKSILARLPIIHGEYPLERPLLAGIDPAARWFSHVGFYAIGENPASLHGPTSKEASQLLNPAILVFPEVIGLSIWDERGASWNLSKAPLSGLKALPLTPKLSNLQFDRARQVGSVKVHIRAYALEAERYTHERLPRENIALMASAVNALDLGFRYGRIDRERTHSVDTGPTGLVEFGERFTVFESCYGAGRCNFLPLTSYSFPEMRIRSLPAAVTFNLWRDAPEQEGSPPDYSFEILLE